MKSILLASASVVAFAGAAAAEVTFGGEATLGFNDTVNAFDDNNDGFYWSANVGVTLSQELDNGVTASATFDFDVADNDSSIGLSSDNFLLSLTSESAGLYYGDTSFAAQTYWVSAGDMEADGFSESDGENVIRGEITYGGITAGLSYVVTDAAGDFVNGSYSESVDQLSVGAKGAFGNFTFAVAYQEESIDVAFDGVDEDLDGDLADVDSYDPTDSNGDFNSDEVLGVSVGTTFGGADLTVAYATETNSDESSIGVQVAYPFGPVTVTAYYVMEDDTTDVEDNFGVNVAYASGAFAATLDYQDDQGVAKTAVDGSYDLGNGIMVYAGFYTADDRPEDEYYVAGTLALADNASLLVAYAVGETNPDDEIGAGDYQEGATVELNFAF